MVSIVLLNGPPRSGKDTAASAITAAFSAFHYKLSHPLKVAIPAFFGLEDQQHALEAQKDQKLRELYGVTFRKAQQDLSEVWAKPLFGKDVLGHIAVRHLRNHSGPGRVCVVSDTGFVEEIIPIVEAFSHRNVLIIQLRRDGCTFDGDTRSYVDYNGVTVQELYNRHDLEGFKAQVVRAVERWHDQRKAPR